MKTKKSLLIIGLVTIAMIAAGTVLGVQLTSNKPLNKQTPSTIFLTIDDTNNTFSLKRGDFLNVTLPDYGDGGYVWTIISIDEQLLSQTEQFSWGSSGMIGDFGKDTWVFTALQTGSTLLHLQCARPFDTSDVCQEFTVTIEIA
jgi:predicted secreted protein